MEGSRSLGNSTLGPACPTPGAEEGEREESGQPGQSENASSQSRPPHVPAAVVQPKAEAALDTPDSGVQLWLRVFPVRLSQAAPPPSLETGWSNVSSEAPGPTAKLSKSRRAASTRPPFGLCPRRGLGLLHSAPAPGPLASFPVPSPPRCLPLHSSLTLRPARPAVAFLPAFPAKWDKSLPPAHGVWGSFRVTRVEGQEL